MANPTVDKQAGNQPDAYTLARQYFKAEANLLCPPVCRAAYSDRMAWILASMSHLAYDHYENDYDARKVFITKLEGGDFELIKTFNNNDTDTQAFLAKAKNNQFAVLAFRGTELNKFKDVRTDVMASKKSVLDGRVHSGFRVAYESVAQEIEEELLKLGDIPIYITGHSLGAALATVATQRLEHNPRIREKIAACYTFGSPRVGNSEYDLEFKSPIYRVVNTTDIVTIIPLLAMGYVHIGDVRYLGIKEGQFQRGIPAFKRLYLFLVAIFKLFSPVVSDHGIVHYRTKLEAIAEKRNRFGH